MRRSLPLCFCALVIPSVFQLACAADYGVGFSLALDHGTASVYFANGSSIDVAKVDGDAPYKEALRDPCVMRTYGTSRSTTEPGCGSLPTSDKSMVQTILAWGSLCSYLPNWLCKDSEPKPMPALKSMLDALKISVDAALNTGAPIPAARVTFPFPISDSFFAIVKATAKSMGLRLLIEGLDPAGLWVAYAKGLGTGVDDSFPPDCLGEQLLLTVDYSNAALSTFLIFESCDVFDTIRRVNAMHIGAAARETLNNAVVTTRTDKLGPQENEMAQVFRNITKLPARQAYQGRDIENLSHVVLLGDRGCDDKMRGTLKKVLQEQSMSVGIESKDLQHTPLDSIGCEKSGDVTFAAARSLAWMCLKYLEREEAEAVHRAQYGEL